MEKEDIQKFMNLEEKCLKDLEENPSEDKEPTMETTRGFCGCSMLAKTEIDGKTLIFIAKCKYRSKKLELSAYKKERFFGYKCNYI